MWIADGWKDYEVIDTSCGEKLERWGRLEFQASNLLNESAVFPI